MECNFENCGYYVDEECTICGMGTDGEDTFCKYCKDNPNCYYKQLAELKAKNFELKESLKCFQTLEAIKALTFYKTGEFELQEKKCIELEQENARLKEKIIKLSEEKGHLIVKNNTLKEANQSLSMLGTDLASANETIRREFFRADENKDMWREKTEKLQQTLQEIKKIAERQLLVTNVRTYQMVYYADFSEYRNEILQKITKAEEE